MAEKCQELEAQQQKRAAERLPDQPWARPPDDLLGELEVEPETGLTDSDADERRKRFGANCIRSTGRASILEVAVDQFKSLMVVLLGAAAIVAFAVGDYMEAGAVLAVILINATIGFATEVRAIRSMEALEAMGRVESRVRRGGGLRDINAQKLVPGDIVIIEAGDVISADLRLIEANNLQANESALTGESVPVEKGLDAVDTEAPLAERTSMLYRGTAVTRGSGEGLVVATGMNTELGEISALTESAEESVTPLEKRLDELGRRLVYVTLAIAVFVALSGVLAGRELRLMIETAIALAIATIPEGLPIVATTALARGMLRMARRNALINRLSAVETLGATSVIAVDKTGTLTEDRMTVRRIALDAELVEVTGGALTSEGELRLDDRRVEPDEMPALRETLRVGMLCNNASLEPGEDDEYAATGDPMEVALLVAGLKAGIDRAQLLEEMPEVREEAFDPELKMMATVHQTDESYCVAIKGAPEAVLEASSSILTAEGERDLGEGEREKWLERNEALAREGLRILAMGRRQMEDPEAEVYEQVTFLGLVGMIDPPRSEVRGAIQKCQDAGIRFVMMTGDQPLTALAIARAVGLVEGPEGEERMIEGRDLGDPSRLPPEKQERARQAHILARVNPEQKLDLIEIHQAAGHVVAMTGDGVNDAPALKKADIGIAMGKRGTQVAREAADMVLRDDRLETIVAAVEQGRVIFGNIRKFVLYLLSCNISEVLVVSLASMAQAPLPILPLQILFLNLVTDVFPALALGVGEGSGRVMERPPRDPDEPVMARRHWIDLGAYGVMITMAVLGALWIALRWLGLEDEQATTVSFLTLAAAQLWHVFNMRDRDSGLLSNDVTRNPWVWGALVLCVGLLAAALLWPALATVLRTVWPGRSGVIVALVMSLLPLLSGQVYLAITNRTRKTRDHE
ncbi:MAG: cation-transporting P-type ATPase [candidate division WS1 bacterium]|jgi:Ca2+-transporting ATPase|nr:cation-transporting P-type ATPase [candidate division WS1 bacterium]